MCLKIFIISIFVVNPISILGDGSVTIPNKIRFPYSSVEGPFMGIFLAISLPIDIPDYSIFFSVNMEANYDLPQNQTTFTYPPLLSDDSSGRSWSRRFLYNILEFKIKSHGYPGRQCLLRAICESSLHTSKFTGVLGDILHVILTPSSSMNRNLTEEYQSAEEYGRNTKSCTRYNKECSVSLLSLFSTVEKGIEHLFYM